MTILDIGIVDLRRVAAHYNNSGFALQAPSEARGLSVAQWIARSRRDDLLTVFASHGIDESMIVAKLAELNRVEGKDLDGFIQSETTPEVEAPKSDRTPTQVLAAALDAVIAAGKKAPLDREAVLDLVREELAKGPARTLVDVIDDGKTVSLEGAQHNRMPRLLKYMGRRKNVMLVGPPGTGKSTAAAIAANALFTHLPEVQRFSAMSVTGQSMTTDFMGYRSPNGELVRTGFRDRFERGGVFILDEVDKGSPNVLGAVQTALSNGWCQFPDALVPMSTDFCMVATGNTWGNGRTATFVGSNALDGAFLNRFARIHWPIDEALESALTLAQGGETAQCWLEYVRRVRAAFAATTLQVIISPRQAIWGAEMLAHGLTWEEVVEDYISGGLNAEALAVLSKVER
jgi:cobaltochelatase CobS